MSQAAAILAAAGLTLAARSSPETHLQVSVRIDRCLSVSPPEVMRLTALELDTRVVTPEVARPEATRVEVSCEGDKVKLRVVDPVTGKALDRTLSLATHEVDVAGRAVALAVAELVLTSWMELTLPQGPESRRQDDEGSHGLARKEAEARVRARYQPEAQPDTGVDYLLAVAQVSGPYQGLGMGWGGGLEAGWILGRPWLTADLDWIAARSSSTTDLGEVRASTWSAALRGSFRLWYQPVWMDLGLGGRFGVARLQGMPIDRSAAEGSVVAGVWAAPIGHVRVGVRVSHLALTLGGECGYVLRGVSGLVADADPVAIDRGFAAGSVALGWAR